MAKLGSVFSVYRSAVYGNVWLPVINLLFVRLAQEYPGTNFFIHENGHLLHTLFGFEGNPHLNPLHIASNVLIIAGFFILASAWNVLHQAQRANTLASSGWYARCRHPQYGAFMLIMFGFLLQWPTLPTIIMFPIMVMVYVRLAQKEEREALDTFGEDYRKYRENTPAWIPKMSISNNFETE
jgi:protein-S-isoprenylcysteine O-methyltransferase Ste14